MGKTKQNYFNILFYNRVENLKFIFIENPYFMPKL